MEALIVYGSLWAYGLGIPLLYYVFKRGCPIRRTAMTFRKGHKFVMSDGTLAMMAPVQAALITLGTLPFILR